MIEVCYSAGVRLCVRAQTSTTPASSIDGLILLTSGAPLDKNTPRCLFICLDQTKAIGTARRYQIAVDRYPSSLPQIARYTP